MTCTKRSRAERNSQFLSLACEKERKNKDYVSKKSEKKFPLATFKKIFIQKFQRNFIVSRLKKVFFVT